MYYIDFFNKEINCWQRMPDGKGAHATKNEAIKAMDRLFFSKPKDISYRVIKRGSHSPLAKRLYEND